MSRKSSWTWESLIVAAGNTMAVAAALDELASTVSGWKSRPGGIPSRCWNEFVKLAASNGRPDITLEVLAELAELTARRLAEARA
jgi:hypothetical protein